jgi:phosphatidylinositol glycan class V
MFDLLVTDHVAQGVVELKSLDTLHWALRPFVKWDSAHLLNIAEGGYANEMESAFFPLYPLAVRSMRSFVSAYVFPSLENNINGIVMSALVMNSVLLFPASSVVLWALLGRWRVSMKWKQLAMLIHIVLNPANAFYVSCYSESLFSFLTWLGMYLLEEAGEGWEDPKSRGGGSWARTAGAAAALFMASCVRSNGVLNATIGLNAVLACRRRGSLWGAVGRCAAIFVAAALPIVLLETMNSTRHCSTDASATDLSWGALCGGGGGGGVGADRNDTIISYTDLTLEHLVTYARRVCSNRGLFYSHIQQRYWGVELLGSYRWRQTPNILLAVPISLFAFDLLAFTKSSSLRDSKLIAERGHLLAHLVVGLALAHVQITTRLLMSACPVMYLEIADVIGCDTGGKSKHRASMAAVAYLLLFSLGGVALHANFYPWT